MTRSVENLCKAALLELYMYVLYGAIFDYAQSISSNSAAGIPEDVVQSYVARTHKGQELEDVKKIVIFIEERTINTSVGVAASAIIAKEISGTFCTLRRTDVRQELFQQFAADAATDNDEQLREWYESTAAEERTHEAALGELVVKLTGATGLSPLHLDEETLREYLDLCFDAVFGRGSMRVAKEFITSIAKQDTERDTLFMMLRLAEGIYWSYCVGLRNEGSLKTSPAIV
jgi:hypothetical protein